MKAISLASAFTKPAWALIAVYFLASLAHFSHNAQFISFYPNMPGWLTREKVWLAWLAVTGVGITGVVLIQSGLCAIGTLTIGAYGALGLDGLGHYTLALCSEHTLMTNVTIWAEVVSGFMLLSVSAVLFSRRIAVARTYPVGIV
jgi:hypothetical protein